MKPCRHNRGSVTLEFALVALALYLLVAGGIELGRLIFVSQTLQDAARLAARELSVTAMPADCTFEQALLYPNHTATAACPTPADPSAFAQLFDPDRLVLDVDQLGTSDCPYADVEGYVNSLPLLNRALRSAFISDVIIDASGDQRRLLRYPGALLSKAVPDGCAGSFTVRIVRVDSRDANGVETIEWIPVVIEVREKPYNSSCADFGPFSFATPAPSVECGNPSTPKGFAAIVINYPFQAAALSGFKRGAGGTADPNLENSITADDDNVTDPTGPPDGAVFSDAQSAAVLDPHGNPTAPPPGPGPYSGDFGLGRQYALNKNVRPYRSLITGQAVFRREVIE